MNLFRFIPIKLTLFLVMGILLGRYWQPETFLPLAATGLLLIMLGILWYRSKGTHSFSPRSKGISAFGIIVALTTVSIGMLSVSLADVHNVRHHYTHNELAAKQHWRLKIHEELKSTTYSNRYLAEILTQGDKKASGTILLSVAVEAPDTDTGLSSKPKLQAKGEPVGSSGSAGSAGSAGSEGSTGSAASSVSAVSAVTKIEKTSDLSSPAPADILLRETAGNKLLQVDDEILVYADLNAVKPPLNPHQFDYRAYLKNLGISHQMRLSTNHFTVEEHSGTSIFGIAASARQRIIDQLKKAHFGQDELGIIQALLLGRRNDISAETYDNYKNAGAVHILAVSGLHIGILLLLLQFLLRPLENLPKGKTLKLVVIVALLWGFAVLAGLSASVVRAVTMFSFVAYALYLNRPGNTFNILALSMFFILLLVDPLLLFQVGFQMSYAAVFSIVWIYPLLQRLWNPKNMIVRYFWQLLSVSIAAQAGVLPISLFYFHQFPGLFFVSNLLIVPVLGLILGMGIAVIFLALSNLLPEWLVTLYDTLIYWMNQTIGWVAQQEAFVFRNISFDAVQLVLVYGILLCSILFLSKPNFKKAAALATMIIGFQLWLFHSSYRTALKETLLVAHQTRNSVLLHQQGNHVSAMAKDTSRLHRLTSDYQVAERIASIGTHSLKNSYRWGNRNVLIIDSLGIYPKIPARTDYLLLSGSPKLNLERLIDSIHPKTIIADGSNYKSYAARWDKTCEERELPFHNTSEQGAFLFEKSER